MSKKNYSINFSEDIFLKKFFFLFFMYSISKNKHFIDIFFKNERFYVNKFNTSPYNLYEFNKDGLNKLINNKRINRYFVSNIFLCKHLNWVFIYLFMYSITNTHKKYFSKHKKSSYYNTSLLYQIHLYSKNNYALGKAK